MVKHLFLSYQPHNKALLSDKFSAERGANRFKRATVQ